MLTLMNPKKFVFLVFVILALTLAPSFAKERKVSSHKSRSRTAKTSRVSKTISRTAQRNKISIVKPNQHLRSPSRQIKVRTPNTRPSIRKSQPSSNSRWKFSSSVSSRVKTTLPQTNRPVMRNNNRTKRFTSPALTKPTVKVYNRRTNRAEAINSSIKRKTTITPSQSRTVNTLNRVTFKQPNRQVNQNIVRIRKNIENNQARVRENQARIRKNIENNRKRIRENQERIRNNTGNIREVIRENIANNQKTIRENQARIRKNVENNQKTFRENQRRIRKNIENNRERIRDNIAIAQNKIGRNIAKNRKIINRPRADRRDTIRIPVVRRAKHLHYRRRWHRRHPHRRIYDRIIWPRRRYIIRYHWGPWRTFRYVYPYYHRKYVFVSLGGYWPIGYGYARYYWYGWHPYRWYGYYPPAYEVQGDTYNYYTYNYHDSEQTTSVSTGEAADGIKPVDHTTFADVREKLATQTAEEPEPETIVDEYFEKAVDAFEQGDYDVAVRNLRLATIREPNDIVLPFAYVQALFANEQYKEAVEVLREALSKLAADQEGVFFPRGLYPKDDILLEQIDALAKKAEFFDSDLQLLLGYQLLGVGKFDEAIESLELASEGPENADAAAMLFNLLEKLTAQNAEDTEQ